MAQELPPSIRWFERIAYAELALPWFTAPFNPGAQLAMHRFGFIAFALPLVISAAWAVVVWRIARRRSSRLRWVWSIGCVLGWVWSIGCVLDTGWLLLTFVRWPSISEIADLLTIPFQIATCYLLFTGEARRWFRNKPIIDLASFD